MVKFMKLTTNSSNHNYQNPMYYKKRFAVKKVGIATERLLTLAHPPLFPTSHSKTKIRRIAHLQAPPLFDLQPETSVYARTQNQPDSQPVRHYFSSLLKGQTHDLPNVGLSVLEHLEYVVLQHPGLLHQHLQSVGTAPHTEVEALAGDQRDTAQYQVSHHHG